MTIFQLATLDGTNKIPSAQLPAGAQATVYTVANQAAMLALSAAGKGDIAVRTDTSESYVLNATPAATLSNWVKIAVTAGGAGAVTSVNGSTGVVTLTASSVGAVATTEKAAANGVATLDSGSKLLVSQLPNEAIDTVTTVASQAAMLALTAQVGDIAIRSDTNQTFVLSATPASTLANWTVLPNLVSSVAGRTGAITLAVADVSGAALATDVTDLQNKIRYARRTTDSTAVTSSTALVADATLSLSVIASAVYEFYGLIIVDSSQTADIKLQITGPTGASGTFTANSIGTAATGTTASIQISMVDMTTSFARGGAGNGTPVNLIISGIVTISTTAGNVGISYAQQTSDATNTVLKAGSFIKLVRIS